MDSIEGSLRRKDSRPRHTELQVSTGCELLQVDLPMEMCACSALCGEGVAGSLRIFHLEGLAERWDHSTAGRKTLGDTGAQTSSYLRSPHPHPSNQSSKVYQVRDPDINNNDYLFLCWTLFWKITKGKEPWELKKTKNKQWYFQDFMRNITQDLIL